MKKVLVIDDTKNIRLLLTKCLELEGYQVESASDGLEALELLKNSKFDLIFLDIKMPKLSGTEVLKCIREMEIQTPVIIITAYPTVKNAVECTKLGAVTYIQKPFTAEKIKSILSDLMSPKEVSGLSMETENSLKQAKELLGAETRKVVTIIEGGEFAKVLARILQLFNYKINVIMPIEKADAYKMNELEINLIPGDGTNINILAEPCVSQSNIVIALMDQDVDNLLSCMYIREQNSSIKTIAKVNSPKFMTKYEDLGIDIAFDSAAVISGLLESTMRNSRD